MSAKFIAAEDAMLNFEEIADAADAMLLSKSTARESASE